MLNGGCWTWVNYQYTSEKKVLWATASHSQGQSRLAHKIQILSFSRKAERLSAVSQIWNQYEIKEYFKAKFYLKTWICHRDMHRCYGHKTNWHSNLLLICLVQFSKLVFRKL